VHVAVRRFFLHNGVIKPKNSVWRTNFVRFQKSWGDYVDDWRVKAAAVDAITRREDIDALKRYLLDNYKNGEMYQLAVSIGCNTGLRAGDLLALKFGQMYGVYLDVREQKTGKDRHIYINGRMRATLNKYLENYIFVADDCPIFSTRSSVSMSPKTLHKIIKDASRALKWEGNYGSHSLRKTFAFHAYAYTQDIDAVSALLLHSDVSVTKKYVDVEDVKKGGYTRSQDEVYSALNL
jgi:integrase